MSSSEQYNSAAQVERTLLAWNRSVLALGANGALVMREGFERELVVLEAIGVLLVLFGIALWIVSIHRYRFSMRVVNAHSLLLLDGRQAIAVLVGLIALSSLDLTLAVT